MEISVEQSSKITNLFVEMDKLEYLNDLLEILSLKLDGEKLEWTKPEIHPLGKSDFKLPLGVYVLFCKTKLEYMQNCPECKGTGHVKTFHHEREFFVPCKKCYPPVLDNNKCTHQ
jgi:hypothetical protein